jgi:hypothetical protein
MLILFGLDQAVGRVIGPHSGQSDRVLASSAARIVVFDYLRPLGPLGDTGRLGREGGFWTGPYVSGQPSHTRGASPACP